MLDQFRPRSEKLNRLQAGPLALHVAGFATLLSKKHNCHESGWRKVRLVAEFGRWLARRRLSLRGVTEQTLERYRNRRRKPSCQAGGPIALAPLLKYLREIGVTPAAQPKPLRHWRDRILKDYQHFLTQERSLAPISVGHYLRIVERFLCDRFPGGRGRLGQLRPQDISSFILHHPSCQMQGLLRLTTTALRSFLGFLFQTERIRANLAAAVPAVAIRPSPDLPRYLEAHQVEQILHQCDRRRRIGKRDFAILLLLARLGLRASEVMKLELEDIDWRTGQLLIHGKGSRTDRLPLVSDVGQALADYIQKGRPLCSSRRVFIQSHAPYEPINCHHSIGDVVERALVRARLESPHRGAHLLRHSLATRMIRNGASLADIAQVLRHQHSRSTEIYAKVDLGALRALAQPWPGGVQ